MHAENAPSFLFVPVTGGEGLGEFARCLTLAQAVLESLVRPGITTVATTHLGPVKIWAVTSEGASCAAMDFDPETLK